MLIFIDFFQTYQSLFFEFKACKDDKNVGNVYKNFAILQKNILDYDIGERMKTTPNQQVYIYHF